MHADKQRHHRVEGGEGKGDSHVACLCLSSSRKRGVLDYQLVFGVCCLLYYLNFAFLPICLDVMRLKCQ